MGSSKNRSSFGGIDTCPGSLVWIRRRNGTWWPGLVMGLDELTASSVLAHRRETPVKLLGKLDATIGWHNVEKSNRIKAFRCGEFDRCIEKVKTLTADANNKNVKYAGREDAIRRALQLESLRNFDISKDTTESQSQSNVSCEHIGQSNALMDQLPLLKKRSIIPNDSEDDSHEGTKRMRGLKDLESTSVPIDIPQDKGSSKLVLPDNRTQSKPGVCHSLSSCFPANGIGTSFSPTKRKCRRRTMTKVLKISSKVDASSSTSYDEGLTVIKVGYGSFQKDNANHSVVEESGTETSGFCENIFSESPFSNGHQTDTLDLYFITKGREAFQHIPVETVTLNDEGLEEAGSTSVSANGDVEAENSKGISRSSNEMSSISFAEMIRSSVETSLAHCNSSFNSLWTTNSCKQGACGTNQPCRELTSQCWQISIPPKSQEWQVLQCQQSHPANNGGSLNCLHDIHIDVDSNAENNHIPLSSVTSKSCNRAIVGHQILVQALEDGACVLENEHNNHEKVKNGCISNFPLRDPRKRGTRSFMRLSAGSVKRLAKIKNCALLSRKMRKLSSITMGNGHKEKAKKSSVVKLSSPDIACVPIKTVFSRLRKALSSTSQPPQS